ncbi:MAG: NnrU family protein [Paracoccaceae bacterium]
MTLLIIGIILWSLAHWFKRLAPEARSGLGNAGKGLVTVGILAGLICMIFGYRAADFIAVWHPPTFMTHINNLLMLIAFFVFGTSATTGRLRGWTRHPMLLSVKIWAVAHLLVNGDLASVLLFGGMLLWAVISVILINKAEPNWTRPEPGEAKKDVLLVAITVVTFSVTVGIHTWLGVSPIGG